MAWEFVKRKLGEYFPSFPVANEQDFISAWAGKTGSGLGVNGWQYNESTMSDTNLKFDYGANVNITFGMTNTGVYNCSADGRLIIINRFYAGVEDSGRISFTSSYTVYKKGVSFLINEELQNATQIAWYAYSDRYGFKINAWVITHPNVYNWLMDNLSPEYVLKSLDKVVGTDATLWLSSIKDEYTNAGDPVVDVSIDYMRSRDPRSLINNLAIGTTPKLLCTTNDTENEKTELLLSWSGDDYTLIGKTTNKISGQTTTQVSVSLGIIGANDYLGILFDDEKEVATITVIEITPSSLRIAYNYEETKSFLNTPTLAHIFYTMLFGSEEPEDEDPDDPYQDNKPNKHGGGGGDRDYTSDDNPNTPLPNAIACDLGFITLFSPDETQLRQLASYMWTDDLFDLDNFKKLFADPMDCILNLSKYPVTVTTQSAKPVVVGNVSTHINMFTVANEFVDVGKGYAKIAQQLNAFLDYSPHTQLEVYLPFCGRHHLNVDLYVQRKFIALSYRINVLTGGCVATLSDKQTGDVLDQFSGNCAYSIPFTSTNYQNAINSLVQAGAGLASGYVGGIMGINPKATITSHVGNVGSAGAVSSLQPYFIFTCPTLVTPADANKIQGQPAYTTHTISELSGFVKVRSIDLTSASATVDELNEIETILKGGAYI